MTRTLTSALLLSLLSGCSANVTVFDECRVGDTTYDVGDSFPAEDGCNTCTCEVGGDVACTTLACTCQGDYPDCAPPPDGCSLDYVCDATGQWSCEVTCDECGQQPPISCEPLPPNCYYTGPTCIDGSWSCGDIICESGCDPDDQPVCPQPGAPNCYSYAECFDTWECVTYCDEPVCEEVYAEGYEELLGIVLSKCGCEDDAPCLAQCTQAQACGGDFVPDACWACIAEEGSICIEDSVYGPECGGSPACTAYVDCALN
jgi:hypothetical protein